MIRSMTAFARVEQQHAWGQFCWEMRSVNHRYLDVSVRMPEEFRGIEVTVQERIQAVLKRGKVNCMLYFQASYEGATLAVNIPLAQQVLAAVHTINDLIGQQQVPNALEILRWPGVLESQSLDIEQISEVLLQGLQATLSQLCQHREREGAQLAEFIIQRCNGIAAEAEQVKLMLPEVLQIQREKLHTRLAELVELDSERLEQEMLMLAQKLDVAEELDRLSTHIQEIRQILTQDQAVGRRLDFLVQELHREANTLGAKSNHLATTKSAIELKVLIEQIREQTQNIE